MPPDFFKSLEAGADDDEDEKPEVVNLKALLKRQAQEMEEFESAMNPKPTTVIKNLNRSL